MANYVWSDPLLQLSHQNPAIQHAVVAVRMMSKGFEIDELTVTENTKGKELTNTALVHYFRAMGQLRSWLHSGLHDVPVLPQAALACCILLILFEFLQGNGDGARIHLANAVKLVSHVQTSPIGQYLLFLLMSLDMASVVWLNLDCGHANAQLPFNQLQMRATPNRQQVDLEISNLELAGIENDILTLSHNVSRTEDDIPEPQLLVFQAVKQNIRSRLNMGYCSFSNLPVNNEWERRRLLHELNYPFLLPRLDLVPTDHIMPSNASEMNHVIKEHDSKLSQFRQILELSEIGLTINGPSSRYDVLTGETPLESTGLLPLFSFRISFIAPLFFVAQTAPEICLRQKAIRLLRDGPWYEGAWDSSAMAAIAERSSNARMTQTDPCSTGAEPKTS